MSGRARATIPGYDSLDSAVQALGVSPQTIYRHLRDHGGLDRLERKAAVQIVPGGIPMPDGTSAPSIAEAARRLGMSESGVRHHWQTHGHLRGAGVSLRARGMEGLDAPRRVTLADVPGIEIVPGDPCPETAPRGSHMVSPGSADFARVIAVIRKCRDEVLAEREAGGMSYHEVLL